ncbi:MULTISPECIES: LacI family DNA-binding transcriptional regulator [unclassified Butyrivibrio]|uniref:LacI family DNA-binding transcriptional regulator n=1 Tax=unclassified Butyrivibrio TaxID=2639466 RepID=UPI0003B38154|nr:MULTISPECIES: LacI family DNA-binding transcriptional regulator [unclassified Butyrivibrio]SDB09627.1 LacI family transcriptional regulator [Butyrivibrio sp. INlla16]
MVSIKDVAREAGVAISTVSKVLNHYPNISESTQKKVMEAVDHLNFVPNQVAAALSSKRSGRIALLLKLNMKTQAIDEIDMQYISGALAMAQEKKLDVITVFYSVIAEMNLEEMIRYFASQSISGIVIFGMNNDDKVLHQLVDSQKFKIVVVDGANINENTSVVGVDHYQAQYDVAEKTIRENKCKKILYIAGMRNSFVTDEKIRAMEDLAKKKKLKLFIRNGDFSELKARNLTLKYAKNRDVVVCGSDLMAIGAMKALIDMDIFRPVCGFDGIILMGYVGKQMNTVKQNFNNVSAEAVCELNRLLNGSAGRKVRLPHTLVRLKYEDIIC